jgi:hypothetical protein
VAEEFWGVSNVWSHENSSDGLANVVASQVTFQLKGEVSLRETDSASLGSIYASLEGCNIS